MDNQWSQDDGPTVLSQPIRGGGFGTNKKSVFLIRTNVNQTKEKKT